MHDFLNINCTTFENGILKFCWYSKDKRNTRTFRIYDLETNSIFTGPLHKNVNYLIYGKILQERP